MAKRIVALTDETIGKLKGAAKRVAVYDPAMPGLAIRVQPSGHKTFVFGARYPLENSQPGPFTRRELGQVGRITLDEARAKAKAWAALIERGIDPRAEEARLREAAASAAAQAASNTFGAVAEDFIREMVVGPDPKKPKQRKGVEVARDIRRVLVPLWGARPVTEITRREIRSVIEGVRDMGTAKMLARRGIVVDGPKKGRRLQTGPAPTQARNLLGYCKQLFGWAVDRGDYGIEVSPCGDLKASKIVGEKKSGDRILSEEELFAFWRAIGRMAYPYRQVYQLLTLTALRLNEAARAAWSEFDLPNTMWVIPAARMKGKNARAREHVVPLTDDMLAILKSLPRFKRGVFLFSTTFGEKPVWMNDKIKKALDQRMLRTLRALARRRGADPASVDLPRWTNHDIRRSVRSQLSRLKVAEEVREAVLAHVRPGIKGVYDRYQYFDEKGEAFTLWAARLRSIVDPPPSNVVPLHGAAS